MNQSISWAALLLATALFAGCAGQPQTAISPPAPTVAPTVAPTEPAAVEPTVPVAPEATGAPEPPTQLDTEMAVVESLDVRILESFPVQVQAVVSGYLPDSCTQIVSVGAINAGTTFRIRMDTERPADALCAMVITNFEEVVTLETAGLPAGAYDVRVNDLMVAFELPSSETPSQPQAQPPFQGGAHFFLETDVEYIAAQVDLPIYDAPMPSRIEIGVIFAGQIARVTGVSPEGDYWRVMCPDDTVGDCWVSAAPEMSLPTTAPN